MGNWKHRLSNVDSDKRTADCAECGPGVRIKWRASSRRAECMTRVRSENVSGAGTPHGLTPTARKVLVWMQDGKCAICHDELQDALVVDHDHRCCPGGNSCGKCRRGMLCPRCNSGLGFFADDPDRLRAAATYLEKFN